MILLELSVILPGIFTIHPTVVINNHTWPGIFHPSMSVFWHPENRSSLDILNHQMRFFVSSKWFGICRDRNQSESHPKVFGIPGGDLTSTSYRYLDQIISTISSTAMVKTVPWKLPKDSAEPKNQWGCDQAPYLKRSLVLRRKFLQLRCHDE